MIKFIIAVALILIAINIAAHGYWHRLTEWVKQVMK